MYASTENHIQRNVHSLQQFSYVYNEIHPKEIEFVEFYFLSVFYSIKKNFIQLHQS